MKTQHRAPGVRRFGLVLLVATGILLGGCSGGTVFALKDPNYPIKPTSVSVITGGSEEADLRLAEYLTQEFQNQTTLHVVGQDHISKSIQSYPITLKTVEEKDGAVAWVDPAEQPRLKKIHAQLKTDYVFVVWSKRMMKRTVCSNKGGCTNTYSADVYGNMLEYPSGKIVSHTAFNRRNSDSILSVFRPKGYYVEELLQKSAKEIVGEFVKVTQTGKDM